MERERKTLVIYSCVSDALLTRSYFFQSNGVAIKNKPAVISSTDCHNRERKKERKGKKKRKKEREGERKKEKERKGLPCLSFSFSFSFQAIDF